MASTTSNLGLTKPAGTDKALVSVINTNSDILDRSAGGLMDAIAIVANGNTHAAISAGQYVYVHNHGTLAEGLYTANSAIAANATLTTSNLTADSGGGLNSLNSNTLKTTSQSITSGDLDDYYGAKKAGLYYVGAGVTNSLFDYSGLLVIAQGTFGAQIQWNHKAIAIRTRTGNPAAWGEWNKISISHFNQYYGASKTITQSLESRTAYMLTVSTIASNNIANIYTAIVVAPPSSSNTGKIEWLTSTPSSGITVTLAGTTLTIVSNSTTWINASLTKL